MSTSAKSVRFDDNSMWVELSDGRTLGIPIAWFPRLMHANPEHRQNANCRLTAFIGTSLMRIFRCLGSWLGAAILRALQHRIGNCQTKSSK